MANENNDLNEMTKIEEEQEQEQEQEQEISQQPDEVKDDPQTQQVKQLFKRMTEEIQSNNPENIIYFMVEFLCKNYPNHVHGIASVFSADQTMDYERMNVLEFMKVNKIPKDVADHFIASGFDTLDTVETLTSDLMLQVEKENGAKWLPGHKVRMQQIFRDAPARVKSFKDERDAIVRNYTSYNTMKSMLPQQPMMPQNAFMTQQSMFQTGSFRTQLTPPSVYVKPITNNNSGSTFKYPLSAGALMK